MNTKVSCVIPAYNEGIRIESVLLLATSHHLIDEVIVVDDGSQDTTGVIASACAGVTYIKHPTNLGKSHAIHTGITHARNDVLCFLDADLIGLEYDNITNLITPVITNDVRMTISMRKNSPWIDRVIGLDYISGERVFHKEILTQHLDLLLTLPGYGLEVFLNNIVIHQKISLRVVPWENVISPYKASKLGREGFIETVRCEISQIKDIFRVISPFEVVYQFISMRRLMK